MMMLKWTTLTATTLNGQAGQGKTYLKFGVYRAVANGMSPALAYVGDFSQSQH
jgi:hypothetical protein